MSSYIPVDLRRKVRDAFFNSCAYCQSAESLMAVIFELEHIIPTAAGGQTNLKNLCLSCPSCNRYKGTRQTAYDLETDKEISLFHPHHQKWNEHFKWSEDGTEIIGLTPTGRATISALKMNRPPLVKVRRLWVKLGEHPPSLR